MREQRQKVRAGLLHLLSRKLQRRPGVHRFRQAGREFEAVFHHANDPRLTAIQLDLASDNLTISPESADPEAVTEHEGGLCSGIVVRGQNGTPGFGDRAEHRHHAAGHITEVDAQRPVATLETGSAGGPGLKLIPGGIEALQVAKFRRRKPELTQLCSRELGVDTDVIL